VSERLRGWALPAAVVLLYFDVLLANAPSLVGQDTWFSLLFGREVVDHGLPYHDTFTTLTAGHSWVDQQWLAHVILYGIASLGGLVLVALVGVLLVTVAFALSLAAARWRGGPPVRTGLVGLLAIFVVISNTTPRAQSLAQPLYVALLWLLLADVRRPSRHVFWSIPLLVLWANLHGSVIVGAGLVLLRAIVEAAPHLRRHAARAGLGRPAVLALGAVVAPFVSPYAPHLFSYYRSTVGSSALYGAVTEWKAPDFRSQAPFFLLAFATVWLAGRQRRVLVPYEQLLLLVTLLAGLQALRNEIWFAYPAVILLPVLVNSAVPEQPLKPRLARLLDIVPLAVAVLGLLIIGGRFAADGSDRIAKKWPSEAAARLAAEACGNPGLKVVSTERFADWLMWKQPCLKGRLAFDIRFELLGTTGLDHVAHFEAVAGPGWNQPFAGDKVVVYDPSDNKDLDRALRASGNRDLYRTHTIAVVVRPTYSSS
jgi:hypothetical protein